MFCTSQKAMPVTEKKCGNLAPEPLHSSSCHKIIVIFAKYVSTRTTWRFLAILLYQTLDLLAIVYVPANIVFPWRLTKMQGCTGWFQLWTAGTIFVYTVTFYQIGIGFWWAILAEPDVFKHCSFIKLNKATDWICDPLISDFIKTSK